MINPTEFPPQLNRRRTRFEKALFKLNYLMHCTDTDMLELASMLATAAWGVWNMIPWKLLQDPIADALRHVMPQWCYGISMITLAAIQLAGLLSQRIGVRRLGNFCAFVAWLFLSAVFLITNFRMAETTIYVIFALIAGAVYIRSGRHYILRN